MKLLGYTPDARESTDSRANALLALGGNTGVTAEPVATNGRPNQTQVEKLAVLASGTSAPGAGAAAITGTLVQR